MPFAINAAGVITVESTTRVFRMTDVSGVTRILYVDFTETRTTEVSEEALINLIYNLRDVEVLELVL